jgi:Raf kinase inhibitor-like YbhB/YbcL family protein
MRSWRIGVVLFLFILAGVVINLRFTGGVQNGVHAPMRIDSFPRIVENLSMLQKPFSLSSAAFQPSGPIPAHYTCDGEAVSPPLSIAGTPSDAKSLVLIVEDPDVPKALKPDGLFLHWLVFDIPPAVTELPEGSSIGTEGENSTGKTGYVAPCPPSDYEPRTHRYIFTIYALDTMLDLGVGATKEDVMTAMLGHVISETRLVGTYMRP